MTQYEIPLTPDAQAFQIQIAETVYLIRVHFAGGWLLDISDSDGVPMVHGIPLVTGADLLEQYRYLGFGAAMYVVTPDDLPPGYPDLGVSAHLVFEVSA